MLSADHASALLPWARCLCLNEINLLLDENNITYLLKLFINGK